MCLTGSIFLCVLTHFGTTVGLSVRQSHFYSVSGFCITTPAQLHETDTLVYKSPPPVPDAPPLLPLPNRM